MTVVALTEADFDAFIAESSATVLLDFLSPSCGTCLLMAPMIDRLAEETGGRVRFAKIDVTANPGLTQRFSVSSLPSILCLESGAVTKRMIGLVSRTRLAALLAELDGEDQRQSAISSGQV